MNVLVTGSRGLVGSAISSKIKNKKHINLINPSREECDLENYDQTIDFFKSNEPDIIVHCAGKVFGIGGNLSDQYNAWRKNTLINMNVIDASVLSNVKHLISLGTGCVYPSEIVDGGYDENQLWDGNVDRSEYGYAHSKRHMLAGLESMKNTYNIGFTYVVSCTLFGPNDNFTEEPGHVIPSLISKFEKSARGENSKVVLWGNGSAVRDFMSSIEMARALEFFIEKGPQGIINVCSGVKRSIKEVIDSISEISKIDGSKLTWDNNKPNGQAQRYYKNQKLKNAGFAIEDTFYKDLSYTYNWYVQNRTSVRR